jgi:hypothetical protein
VSVALVIQREKRMLRIIQSSVVCLVVLHFTTLSRKQNDFCKTVIKHKMFVLSLSAPLYEVLLLKRI